MELSEAESRQSSILALVSIDRQDHVRMELTSELGYDSRQKCREATNRQSDRLRTEDVDEQTRKA